jgi:hypothetical protein
VVRVSVRLEYVVKPQLLALDVARDPIERLGPCRRVVGVVVEDWIDDDRIAAPFVEHDISERAGARVVEWFDVQC